jgi:hypothetical protein
LHLKELARDIGGQVRRVEDIILSPGMALVLLFLVGFLSGYAVHGLTDLAVDVGALDINVGKTVSIAIPVLVTIMLIALLVGGIAGRATRRRG